jgi:exodeoxyribonuclease V beta subunit
LFGTNLVEASAGTGKTYAIATLFVRLLLERQHNERPLRVHEILVVTFTEAATLELRDRIRSRLTETLRTVQALKNGTEPPDPVLAEICRGNNPSRAERLILAALGEFDNAAISTIHGFCQRTLQQSAFESGVPFKTELIEDLRPLLEEIVLDFWSRELIFAPLALAQRLKAQPFGAAEARALAQKISMYPTLELLPAEPEEQSLDDAPREAAFRNAQQSWKTETLNSYLLVAPLQRSKFRRDYVAKWCA